MARYSFHSFGTLPAHKVIRAIAFAALLISLVSPVAFAHSVTMNFRFNKDVTDVTHISANYASVERSNTLAALVFAGSLLIQISLETSDPYLFNITQDESQNRFLLAFTNGTWQKIENKPAGKVPATTFGDLAPPTVIAKGLAVQLQFDTRDLSGMLGPGQIFIKSLGKVRLPSIELTIVG